MGEVVWHDSLPSTMQEASRMASAGAASGTVVAAREQTDGQGRQGRQWLSHAGDGLYCTFILRLDAKPADLPCVTLALGLAVVEAVSALTGLRLNIRWPNDILWETKKLCGILARLEHGAVLAGIGVNLNQLAFPEGLSTPAASLRMATGASWEAETILESLRAPVESYVKLEREAVLRLFTQGSSYVSGRRVSVDSDGHMLYGVTDGLDEFGFLRIRKDDGKRETVLAGGVRPID